MIYITTLEEEWCDITQYNLCGSNPFRRMFGAKCRPPSPEQWKPAALLLKMPEMGEGRCAAVQVIPSV